VSQPVALEVVNAVKHYVTPSRGEVHALDGVSVRVEVGDVLGVVGESGCGKSTLARLMVKLEAPDQGSVRLFDEPFNEPARAWAPWRRGGASRLSQQSRRAVQLVFQDPYASLDPRQRVDDAIAEVLRVHGLPGSAEQLIELVGLPMSVVGKYPHQLSGGQRQRIGIARALAVEPKVLVLDEPVSALDVSVRAEIINLLERLRRDLSLTYVFISHDLGMVRHLSDRIAVMYLGKIVEYGPWQQVSDHPLHPYTRALQAAIPIADPELDERASPASIVGEVPDASNPPPGCRFAPRCPIAEARCATEEPPLAPTPDGGVLACHVVARSLSAPTGPVTEAAR